MNWWAVTGISCTGLLMGWFFRYSLERFPTYSVKTMGASLSIVLGAGLTGIFQRIGGTPKPENEVWLYPIGLLLGVMFTSALNWKDEEPLANNNS